MSANSEGIDGFRPRHTSRQESVKTRVAEVHWWPDQESAAIKASTPFEKKYAVRRLHSLIDSVLVSVGHSVAFLYQRSDQV